jgi:hypothetical protein
MAARLSKMPQAVDLMERTTKSILAHRPELATPEWMGWMTGWRELHEHMPTYLLQDTMLIFDIAAIPATPVWLMHRSAFEEYLEALANDMSEP